MKRFSPYRSPRNSQFTRALAAFTVSAFILVRVGAFLHVHHGKSVCEISEKSLYEGVYDAFSTSTSAYDCAACPNDARPTDDAPESQPNATHDDDCSLCHVLVWQTTGAFALHFDVFRYSSLESARFSPMQFSLAKPAVRLSDRAPPRLFS